VGVAVYGYYHVPVSNCGVRYWTVPGDPLDPGIGDIHPWSWSDCTGICFHSAGRDGY
jgi:hypothetical protein